MSMTRSIQRNIAHENMARAGMAHVNQKGYASSPSKKIRFGKAFRQTLTSVFALNWREFVPRQITKKRKK